MQGKDWRLMVILYGFGMAAAAAMGMLGPLVGDLAPGLGVPVSLAGSALLFQLLPGALAGSFIGTVIDRVGARTVLLLAGTVVVAVDLSQFFVSNLPWFCVNLLIQGVALNGILASAQVMVTASATGKRQMLSLTIWSTVNFVGYAAGQFLVAAMAGGAHWRNAFLYHAAVAALFPIIGLSLPVVKATLAKTDLLAVLKEPKVLLVCLSLGFAGVAGVGTNAGISLYLSRVQHIPLSLSASFAGTGNIISICGSFLVAWLLSRGMRPGRVALAICVVAIVCGPVLYYPGTSMALVVATLFISQSCASAITALTYSTMPSQLNDQGRVGAATGMLVQIGGIGAMLGPPLYFTVQSFNQYPLMALTLVALWAAAFIVLPFKRGAAARTQPIT